MNRGEWDECEGEAVGCAVERGEADAVDCDEAFFDDVAGRGLRTCDSYEFGVTIVVDFFDLTGAINVSLHQVAADARVVFESSFEVDVSALLEFSEPG